jgi:hypothetical protein
MFIKYVTVAGKEACFPELSAAIAAVSDFK